MIESELINYGVLGLWTLSLLYERYTFGKNMRKVIEENTRALIYNYQILNKCKGELNNGK